MKVLLINTWCHSLKTPNEPMGLCYLAAVLRESGVEVKIIDMIIENLNYEDLISIVDDYDVIGLTILVPDYIDQISKFVSRVKTVDNIIVAGGYEPTLNSAICMKRIDKLDGVILGEGELTFLELVKKIENGEEWKDLPGLYRVDTSRRRSLIKDLDSLPYPVRDYAKIIVEKNLPFQICSSRGCYGKCSFCSISAFYAGQAQGKGDMWRGHSAERILREINFLQKTYGTVRISFSDDNFMGPEPAGIERARKFAELLIKYEIQIEFRISARMDNCPEDVMRLLKKAGLNQVFSGAENANKNVLDYFNKGIEPADILNTVTSLKKLKVDMQLGFIWFTDRMTIDELENNIRFVEQIGSEYIYHPGNSRLRFNAGTELSKTSPSSGFVHGEVQKVFNVIDEFYNKNRELYEDLTRMRFDYWGHQKGRQINMAYKELRDLELSVLKDAIADDTMDYRSGIERLERQAEALR